MTEQALLEAEPAAVPTDSKWIAGISPDQPVCEVAGRVLDARLKAVCQSLPLAAEKSDEDVEHVHQLRISVRRAVEAVRVFSGLMEEAEVDALRDRLRRIRLAADEARNWDVMAERFSHGGDIPAQIVERIKARRREVQGPIVAVYQEITADAWRGEDRERWSRKSNPTATAKENGGSDGRLLSTSPRSSRSSSRPPSPTSPPTNRCMASASARRSCGTRWRSWPWPSIPPSARSSIPR